VTPGASLGGSASGSCGNYTVSVERLIIKEDRGEEGKREKERKRK
jgi:hypothetical protein